MPTPISPASLKILNHLLGYPPRTVAELVRELGVTRTAVVEQLDELLKAGLVERAAENQSRRGRPSYRYTTTQAAALMSPGNQHLLVPAVWKSLQKIGGEDLLNHVIDEVSTQLAEGCRLSISATGETLTGLELLERCGGCEESQTEENGVVRVTKRTCRFCSMFDDSEMLCRIHLQTLEKIVGSKVTRTQWRRDGDPCCVFEVGERKDEERQETPETPPETPLKKQD